MKTRGSLDRTDQRQTVRGAGPGTDPLVLALVEVGAGEQGRASLHQGVDPAVVHGGVDVAELHHPAIRSRSPTGVHATRCCGK